MPIKILVVEDEDTARLLLVSGLKKHGYEVVGAKDGVEGLQAFGDVKPDIVLSDIMMPRMTGLEMLESIRKTNSSAVVIMTTSQDTADFTLRALRLRANDYLLKPVNLRDILALLEKYSAILEDRTRNVEVLGAIYERRLGMAIGNRVELVAKVVDRLMLDTEGLLAPTGRLAVHLALVEVLVNAIEHGNLEIAREQKTAALNAGGRAWADLVAARLADPVLAARQVKIEFTMHTDCFEWVVTDAGRGFDFKSLPDPTDPQNLLRATGRGLILARLSLDELSFLGTGNQVRMRKLRAPTTAR